MDETVREMVLTTYDALGKGQDKAAAHGEGITATAMCPSAMTGVEDAVARAQVEALGLGK